MRTFNVIFRVCILARLILSAVGKESLNRSNGGQALLAKKFLKERDPPLHLIQEKVQAFISGNVHLQGPVAARAPSQIHYYVESCIVNADFVHLS